MLLFPPWMQWTYMPLEAKTFVPVGGIGYAQKLDNVYNINFTPLPMYVKEHFHYKTIHSFEEAKLEISYNENDKRFLSIIITHTVTFAKLQN